MVARTPQKQRQVMVAPLNPLLIRETINKVDKCMERLQELQYTVAGGNKVVCGVNLSPRSTRSYLKTSLRCKQETLRIKNASTRKSPVGKFPAPSTGDWKRMSLPAMLLGETVGEIIKATQFTREIVETINTKKKSKRSTPEDEPKTPDALQKTRRTKPESTSGDIRTRRKKEKQNKLQTRRSEESDSPTLQRARSRIIFRIVSPPKIAEKEQNRGNGSRYLANRVSPRHKPWAKKTVLFPNPLFLSASSTQQAKFCRTRSPVIARNNNNSGKNNNSKQSPHKFLIRSPPSASKFQVKINSPPKVSISPTRLGRMGKSPPKSTASKLRRSLSPARLASRLVSPLKSRKTAHKNDELVRRLIQRPVSVPKRFSTGRN